MLNPFSQKQIRNYLLFYTVIITIVVLFYVLNTSINPTQTQEKKHFNTRATASSTAEKQEEETHSGREEKSKILLLDRRY